MPDSCRKKIVQFGAGNIGRSFIGQLFARNGWEVVFIDVNEDLVGMLNEKGEYRVHIKTAGEADEVLLVSPVRAVLGNQRDSVINELSDADLICTSVGAAVLPLIVPVIAKALQKRTRCVDLILAENLRNGADTVRKLLETSLPGNFPLTQKVGLVETSIGKMVPIMRAEDLVKDPLAVFAEEYNSLIVDRSGFLGPVPDFEDLKPVENITAYVDRKLFIHNLGHAAAAYLGNQYDGNFKYIWEVLEVDCLYNEVEAVMFEAAETLLREYPETFDRDSLRMHISDLLSRFQNKALGDTLFRVGRDIPRKLSPDDRIAGAIRLAAKHDLPWDHIKNVYEAACSFRALDESGHHFPKDREFFRKFENFSIEDIMRNYSHIEVLQ